MGYWARAKSIVGKRAPLPIIVSATDLYLPDNADVFSTTFTATLGPSPWNAISGSISSAPRGVYAISVFVQPLLMGAFDATRDEASVGEPQPRISVSIGIGASVRPGLGIRTR